MIFRHPQYAISEKDKDRILKQQENHCHWCGFSFDQKLDIENTCIRLRIVWVLDDMGLIASCQFCDAWMSGTDFTTLKEVRDFVRLNWTIRIAELRSGGPKPRSTVSSKTFPIKDCPYCGLPFIPNRSWQKCCSKDCQWKYWDKNHPRIKKEA